MSDVGARFIPATHSLRPWMELGVHVLGRVLNLPSARPRVGPRGGRSGLAMVGREPLIPYPNRT